MGIFWKVEVVYRGVVWRFADNFLAHRVLYGAVAITLRDSHFLNGGYLMVTDSTSSLFVFKLCHRLHNPKL